MDWELYFYYGDLEGACEDVHLHICMHGSISPELLKEIADFWDVEIDDIIDDLGLFLS